MISPIKQNISFKGEMPNDSVKYPKEFTQQNLTAKPDNVDITSEPADVSKPTAKQIFMGVKLTAINALKTFNTATGVSGGIIGGVVKGTATAALVGFIGKNVKSNSITGSLKGMGSDIFKAAKGAAKFVPSLITKAPIENAKNIAKILPNFYTQYLKGHKGTAAIATAAGLGVFAYNALKGKVKANMNNANVDHATNVGHIRTK